MAIAMHVPPQCKDAWRSIEPRRAAVVAIDIIVAVVASDRDANAAIDGIVLDIAVATIATATIALRWRRGGGGDEGAGPV